MEANPARTLGYKVEVVDQIFWHSWESGSKFLSLGCNTDWAVIGVAHASHDASSGNHGNGTEAILVSSQCSGDEDVTSCSHTTIYSETDTLSESVCCESLVNFSKSHLDGSSSMLD